MNGAELLIATAKSEGIEICFANPGTTEMPFVAAFDSEPGIRPVLGLHETVCTSAADGYARMKGRPAMVLLHLGPGLANGTANLHNARRAHVPIFVVVGDHTTWHRPFDPLLNMDVESLARTSSGYVKQNRSAETLGSDTAEAIAQSRAGGGQISTLVVPHDSQWTQTDAPIPQPSGKKEQPVSSAQLSQAAKALAETPGKTALMLGGAGLSEAGLKAAGRIAEKSGCQLITDNFFTRMERGAGLPPVDRLAYFPEEAAAQLGEFECVVLAGLRPPVAFFGYQDGISEVLKEEQTVSLCGVGDDVVGALASLAQELGAADGWEETPLAPPKMPEGDLAPEKLSAVIAALQPEGTILVDEGLTSAVAYFEQSKSSPRFTHMMLTGGAIGFGPGAALGAALACPERKVINFQADGSGAYTLQALWSQAREGANVLTIIASNRSYAILRSELGRAGIQNPGPSALGLSDLGGPDLDWVSLARGFGVEGQKAHTVDELKDAMQKGLAQKGPYLIEAVLA